jgi:cytochrome P450
LARVGVYHHAAVVTLSRVPWDGFSFSVRERCNKIVRSIVQEQNTPIDRKVKNKASQQTFFHDVLDSNLPLEEKSPERLAQEVQVVIGAGAETTGKMLTWTTYHLLENPDKLNKLKEELNRLDPNQTATLVDYEQMSYLVSSLYPATEQLLISTDICHARGTSVYYT